MDEITYTFQAKDCPYCKDNGYDERERYAMFEAKDECKHRFTNIEYGATLTTIEDLEAQLKEVKKTARAMKKVIDKSAQPTH